MSDAAPMNRHSAEIIPLHAAATVGVAAVPEAPAHVVTPTGRRISKALATAQTFGVPVLIEAASGLGKTVEALHFAETHSNVWLTTMAPHCRGVWAMLDEMADSLGVGSHQGQAPHRVAREIIGRLKEHPGVLLIVDEVQHLEDAALEELRSIHDRTRVGLALIGSISLYGRLVGGSRTDKMAQVRSRIAQRLSLRMAVAGDVDALLDAWQVRGPAERRFLHEIAKRPGALRAMGKTLSLALAAATADGRKAVAVADIRESWALLGGVA
jgi:DNA transposition AAA+ family ATPase